MPSVNFFQLGTFDWEKLNLRIISEFGFGPLGPAPAHPFFRDPRVKIPAFAAGFRIPLFRPHAFSAFRFSNFAFEA
jgi:hypothetical protein